MSDSVIGRVNEAEKKGKTYNVFKGRENEPKFGLVHKVRNMFDLGDMHDMFVTLPSGDIVPGKARMNSALGKLTTGGANSLIMSVNIDGREIDAGRYLRSTDGEIHSTTEEDVEAAVEAGKITAEEAEAIKERLWR